MVDDHDTSRPLSTPPLSNPLIYALAIGITLITYWLGVAVYNIYFHPLRSFPGPISARATLLWRVYYSTKGRFHRAIEEQHKHYGSVVRVSPNELSFASVTSWKEIYGHHPGKPAFIKGDFYEVYGSGFERLDIGSERDPKTHSRMKRSLAGAFSTKALSEQEDIIMQNVDAFLERVGRDGSGPNGLNVTKWYEMISFDILGEMAFGESFHCIDRGEPHFWQELIVSHLFFITLVDNLRRYPFLVSLGKYLAPRLTYEIRNKHSGYSRDLITKRIANKSSRKDFLTHMVAQVEAGEVAKEELTAHSSTLVIAGGETISTFLAASTYHLLKNPSTYHRLREEIRDRYESIGQIDATSAQQLPYLQAVISEGLRIYPPGSQGFPRVSPGTTIDGRWIPKGAEVYTSAWTVTHKPQYFHDPMQFKPERWVDPECADLKEASQPFSLGTRGCLGRNFAYVEMALIMAKMHYRYNLDLVNKDLDWEGASHMHIMWWKPDLYVRFLEREGMNIGPVTI